MYASKVEVTLRRYVGDVGRDALFLAQLPDLCARLGVVYRGEDHRNLRIVKVGRLELLVKVFDLLVLDTMRNFGIKAISGADQSHSSVGIEEVEYAAGGHLDCVSMSTLLHKIASRPHLCIPRRLR